VTAMTRDADNPVAELTADECWELLQAEELGRLAYRLVDEVHLVPINYVVDGDTAPKYDVVELTPEVVTGRRFLLQRPSCSSSS
jgi:nitroimidazol reductase NimA-like FMN-containing flavoprotein (pyridoxamine 5'-phosphate oxidase superfamily)